VAKEDRGFASMDRAKQREIASKGGKAAHQKGTAHEWTSEEARDAGRKGGIASHQRRREQGVQGEDEGGVGMNRDASPSLASSLGSSSSSSSSSSSNMSSERDSSSSDRSSSSTESRMPNERDE
jgi:general stress protein YciG